MLRPSPYPYPYRRRASGALLALSLLAAAGPAAAQERVRIPRDCLSELTAGAPVEASVGIIRERAADTARVVRDALTLNRGEFAVLKTGAGTRAVPGPVGDAAAPAAPAPASPGGETFYATAIRLVTPDATATGVWVLRPIYRVANRMRWEPAAGHFRGALFFAIEDSLRRGESRPLPTPVRMQLLTEADSVAPADLAIAHTNFPLVRVDLVARRAADSMRVHLVPEVDVGAGVDIWVPVEPALEVVTTPSRIQGWGIETARVVVRAIGTTSDAVPVANLLATSGELDAVQVPLGPGGSGSVRLRSAGAGEAVLRASAPGLGEATAVIQYLWPWAFFLSALLGGVFGGLAAAVQERRAPGRGRAAEYALKGVVAGLLASLVWYALGVDLLRLQLGVPRQNELAVFSLAAIAGYFGIPRTAARQEEEAAP